MPRGDQTWKCHRCGEVLRSWAAAERHADAHGGARIECVIEVKR